MRLNISYDICLPSLSLVNGTLEEFFERYRNLHILLPKEIRFYSIVIRRLARSWAGLNDSPDYATGLTVSTGIDFDLITACL